MKQIIAGRLGPVFHPDGSVTFPDVDSKDICIGDHVEYVGPKPHGAGPGFDVWESGTVIAVSGDTVTVDQVGAFMEIPEVPDLKEVPLHHYQPTHEEISKLAGELWLDNGGGWTSQDEADDNWYEAEALLKARHCD